MIAFEVHPEIHVRELRVLCSGRLPR